MTQPGAVAPTGRWQKGKRIGMAALFVAAAAGAIVAADFLFYLRPIAAEVVWRAALASPVAPLQHEAIRRLRNHATRAAAVSLVEFINEKTRAGDWEPAVRAAETLCVLSGRSFGSWFRQCSAGRTWAKLAGDEWPGVVERINAWASGALGTQR